MNNKYIDMVARFGSICLSVLVGFLFAAFVLWLAAALGVIAEANAKETTPKPAKPQIEVVRKLGERTFVVGAGDTARVVRTVANCRGWGTGVTVERAGDVSFITFYQRKTRFVAGLSVGDRWTRTTEACEIAKEPVTP